MRLLKRSKVLKMAKEFLGLFVITEFQAYNKITRLVVGVKVDLAGSMSASIH